MSINFEHSWGDGVAVMRFIKESLKDTTEKPQVHPEESIQPTRRDGIDPSKHVRRLGIRVHHLGDE